MRDLSSSTTTQLDRILERLSAGDPAARDALLEHSVHRLRELARRELRRFPRLRRWEDSDDVLQGAARRLIDALDRVVPPTARDFFNLSTRLIRNELIDLCRHHFGPMGSAVHHATPRPDGSSAPTHDHMTIHAGRSAVDDPARIVERAEVHEQLAHLAPEQGELVSLLWYQELSREQAARVLGVSVRTVSRRWRETRLAVHALLRE